jgi:hypothetical protein
MTLKGCAHTSLDIQASFTHPISEADIALRELTFPNLINFPF